MVRLLKAAEALVGGLEWRIIGARRRSERARSNMAATD